MSNNRPIYLWVEHLVSDLGGFTLDLLEIDGRPSFEFGEPPQTWYVPKDGRRISLSERDIFRLHVHNRGWLWRSHSPEIFPEPPFLVTDDPAIHVVHDRPVGIRPLAQTRELMEGAFSEDPRRFVEVVTGPGWFGILTVTREDDHLDRGHLIAFKKSGVLAQADLEEIFLPSWHEPFGAMDLIVEAPEDSPE